MVRVVDDHIVDEADIRVKWDSHLKIGEGALRVVDYNKEENDKLAVDQKEAFDKMEEWLDWADYIVGHNLFSFDFPLIQEHCRMNNKEWKKWAPKIIDTKCLVYGLKTDYLFNSDEDDLFTYQLRIFEEFKRGVKTNLTLCAKERGIEHDYDSLHDALCDLKLNIKLFDKLKWELEI